MKWVFTLSVSLILLTACSALPSQPTLAPTGAPQADMPNPASAYCVDQGYRSEIRTAADGSQSGVCIFPDGSECDEWAYFRGECGASPSVPTSMPGEIPTAMPIDPADYAQGWWTYTHADNSFSIMLPEDWVVEEITTSDPLMNGHTLNLHPRDVAPDLAVGKENIRMTFRHSGEDARLWPTGVGQGKFFQQGTLEVAGQPARRMLLVCPGGEVTTIWYHSAEESEPNIVRGDMEFGFIYSAGEHCEPGLNLGGKTQRWGEMIIASLKVSQ